MPTWLSAADYGDATRSAADLNRTERDARVQDRLYRDCLARQNG